jgi:hypothetical protein
VELSEITDRHRVEYLVLWSVYTKQIGQQSKQLARGFIHLWWKGIILTTVHITCVSPKPAVKNTYELKPAQLCLDIYSQFDMNGLFFFFLSLADNKRFRGESYCSLVAAPAITV